MNADIANIISNCEACQQYKSRQGVEPFTNYEILDKPPTKAGIDLVQGPGENMFLWSTTQNTLRSTNFSTPRQQ